jgi:methylated-DNA-[protein]-cysteine S-methyltransferase
VEIAAYEVPGWGVGEVWFRDGVLVNHELPTPRRRAPRRAGRVPPLRHRLVAYFSGEPVTFDDVELDLDGCTPFHRAIVDALRVIPWGETVTYGELAALAGHPNAYRAAGSVCARNRFPLVVPCHRVVAAGSLGRYGSLGLSYKRRLLALEGAV